MAAVRDRKRRMVAGLLDMHKSVFASSGADLILGRGRLVGPHAVQVQLASHIESDGHGEGEAASGSEESQSNKTRMLTADHIILCTGSRANLDLGISGLEAANPLTHIELLDLDSVPRHLVILGGGYIGLEFAQVFRRFGAAVSVMERGSRMLKGEDADVSSALVDILRDEGVAFFPDTHVSRPFELSGSHLLVAGGRLPNTHDVGLQAAGVELTPSGHVKVDAYLRTSIDSVFAVGDCAGSPHFTHAGFDDFRIVRDVLLHKTPLRSTRDRHVPYTLYTDPELAHVGLTEQDAAKAGIEYRLATLPMAAFLRTRTMDATRGFAKALVGVDNDGILGFTALGPRAGELLPVVQLAMSAGLPYTSIAELIVTHPTMNEGLVSLFGSVPPRTT
ncbi:hypothetical protein ACJBU6_01402 [Exserohilum turcicum]